MNKGTRYKKDRKSIIIKKLISLVLFLFFISLFIVSGIKIIKYLKDAKSNEKIFDEISKDIVIEEDNIDSDNTKYNINFTSLKQKNSDTVGFIKVNGTDIEHIVVQGKDNNYYLSHNFEKNENSAGWIFADYKNKFDGTDKNIVVYGHNRKDGSMFGTLKNILNENWYNNDENLQIKFITQEGEDTFQVFSIYRIEKEDYYITTSFKSDFNKFFNTIKKRSIKNFDIELNENDQILTLSTCDDNNKYRVVLHAKKII